ncbi:MAG: MarR family transcriptional regulator [Solirubrobacterales bacterium]
MASISSSPNVSSKAVAEEFTAIVTNVMKRSSTPMVEFVERYDLSFTQLKVMFALANNDEPLPIGRIAEITGGSLPATGRAVDGLVRHGLTTRTEDPTDRRVKRVEVTDLGTTGMNEIFESRTATLSALLDGLSPDQLEALGQALQPLRALVENPANCETEVSR